MLIRVAATDDIEILKEHDRHITKQELENIIYDRLGYLAIGGFQLESSYLKLFYQKIFQRVKRTI